VSQFVGVTKRSKTDSSLVHTKGEAVAALWAAWALARDWRAEMRALTPFRDARFPHSAVTAAWEDYDQSAFVEMRGLERFVQGLGQDPVKAWEIYKAVGQEIEPSEANRDVRLAAVRERTLAAQGK
jgi:hypothetical protein